MALLAAFLYERAPTLAGMYLNAPARLARVDNLPGPSAIKFAERAGFRSCEDALMVESLGLAVVACDPGRERWNTVMGVFVPGPVSGADFYVYDYKNVAAADDEDAVLSTVEIVGFPGGDDLHTLGMAFDEATSTLLVSNHAQAGPRIEIFKLDFDLESASPKPKATHVRTVRHALIHGPNSIAIVEGSGGTEFFVTNDHAVPAVRNKLVSVLETYLAPPTGTVVHVDLRGDDEVEASVVAHVPFANGIEFLNATTLAVASTSRSAVYLYSVTGLHPAEASADDQGSQKKQPPTLIYVTRIPVPFLPDNLTVTKYKSKADNEERTKLLIAGHAHAPTLTRFSASRHVCNDPTALAEADETARAACDPEVAAPSWVSEWSEADGLTHLYVSNEYPSSATAARDGERGVGIISGLYAKGLLVWRE